MADIMHNAVQHAGDKTQTDTSSEASNGVKLVLPVGVRPLKAVKWTPDTPKLPPEFQDYNHPNANIYFNKTVVEDKPATKTRSHQVGDWIVEYPDGSFRVVSADYFNHLYHTLDKYKKFFANIS